MAQPQVFNGYNYYQQPDGSWKRGEAVAAPVTNTAPQVVREAPPPPPPAPPSRTTAGAATEGLKAGFMWIDPANPQLGQVPIPVTSPPTSREATTRRAELKRSLEAIQQARKQAEAFLATGSASQFLQNVPGINQNRLNLETTLDNAFAGLVQDKVKELAAANQGGVSGMANSLEEARRMGASIANLNPNQDLPSLLAQLQRAEEYYLGQAALIEGKPAPDKDIINSYLPTDRVTELRASEQQAPSLTTDGTVREAIPPEYQQRLTRYLIQNKDTFDPSQYAAFLQGLDREFGVQGVDIQSQVDAGYAIGDYLRKGGDPALIKAVPAERDLSAAERAVTEFAATAPGAATVSFLNSASAGLPQVLTGRGEAIEAVRQNQPVASLVGDIAGGITGTAGLGRLGLRGLAGNPMVQNAAFGGVSGATQSEDPLLGAAIGAGASLGGDVLGRQIGAALPRAFAPGSTLQAIEAVPTSGELGNQADRLYRQAAAQGQMIQPAQTNQFIDDTEAFLRQNGYMTQQGELIGTGPVQDATRILQSFRDQPIGPMEAQTIRNKIAEGRTAMREGAPDLPARTFSGNLTNQFDQFAEAQDALPGIAAAREVAQRRIIGRELQTARELGQARGDINYSQGGEDLGIRRAFGALDTADVRGAKMYPQAVEEAIRVVSRGTPARNIARGLSKLSPQGGGGLIGGGLLGVGVGAAAGDAVTGGLASGALYGLGAAGRGLGGMMTRQDAELAELIARGGPQFQQALQQAREEAAIRAGRIGAGLFGSTVPIMLRD